MSGDNVHVKTGRPAFYMGYLLAHLFHFGSDDISLYYLTSLLCLCMMLGDGVEDDT
jgi:hypothetical protein